MDFKKLFILLKQTVASMHCMTYMCNSNIKCTNILSTSPPALYIRIQQTLGLCKVKLSSSKLYILFLFNFFFWDKIFSAFLSGIFKAGPFWFGNNKTLPSVVSGINTTCNIYHNSGQNALKQGNHLVILMLTSITISIHLSFLSSSFTCTNESTFRKMGQGLRGMADLVVMFFIVPWCSHGWS